MAFRFGNGLFEPIWNRDRIDHVHGWIKPSRAFLLGRSTISTDQW